MSTLHGRTRVDANGVFRVPVPLSLTGQDVEYTLTVNPANDSKPLVARVPLTQAEWERHIDETAGSIPDFPDIERPGPDSYEKREEL